MPPARQTSRKKGSQSAPSRRERCQGSGAARAALALSRPARGRGAHARARAGGGGRRRRARPHDAQRRDGPRDGPVRARPEPDRRPDLPARGGRERHADAASSARSTAPAARPASARASRSPATTTSPRPRSASASATSPRPSCARCATTSGATRTASPCCRTSSASSASLRTPAILGAGGHSPLPPPPARLAAGISSSSPSTASPTAATASRAVRTATSSSSPAPCPATACAPRSASPSARTPRRAPSRSSSRRPTASRPVADHPGAPWQVLPYERQLEVKQEQVDDALTRIGRLEGYELEPIVPAIEQWRYRNKLEYSFGTGEDGELVCGFHAPGRWDEIVPLDDCMLASERGNAVREQVARRAARARASTPGTAARSSGFLRNLVVREGRRTGELQVRLVTSPGKLDADALIDAVDADGLFWTQTDGLGESTQGGETALLRGGPQLHEQLGDLRFLISPEAFFQTNTEMAEVLYGHAAEAAGAARPRARLRPLLRHRHDRPLARHAGARGRRRGDRRAGRRRRDRERAAQRDHQRLLLRRRHPARDARAGRARRQARRRGHRPAARRPVAEGRAPHHRGRAGADRLRLLQPDDARARTRRSSSRRAGR